MFLPWIIAVLLGLASPATNSSNQCNHNGTVQVSSEEGTPDDSGDGGGEEEDPEEDGPGTGTGTGGGAGQTPPPNP